ncbi:HNH endonuclease [Lysinibacillus sphaericus]|uniref:HNH endonuclease n=1 Tax=Lysinibacillus sphaericus TaxID=1421 RepID=UPI002161A5B6|nr:HNH endonuclease [Lysinibacillus sphaericus]MCS1382597.1 HNH endonuclease [Lysinibacillus sphaericus]
MIKINKVPCPPELTSQKKQELTNRYLLDGNPVWKQPYIKKALLESSHVKCVYCECKLEVESKYMEVEHFQDKKTYPEEVINWDNLLPSCKRCNGLKGNFDTKNSPFINPAEMDPKEHLILNHFRLYPISNAGENTVEVLVLNDIEKLMKPRYDIFNTVISLLENIYKDTCYYIKDTKKKIKDRNNIIINLNNLMTRGTAKSEYAAFIATILHNSHHFQLIYESLISEGMWDQELQEKLNEINSNCLDTDVEKAKKYQMQ